MASKLHRKGLPSEQVNVWEPGYKGGVRQVVNNTDAAPRATQAHVPDLDDRVRDLERQAEARVQAAYQRGLQEGDANGRQQAAAQVQAALDRLARTVDEISGLRAGLRHEAEQDVVKLAMAIAKRILYRELSTDPEALLGLIRSTLDKLDGREVHRLRANPQDAAVLQKQLQNGAIPRKIEVIADGNLPRGAAIFETAQGTLDASVDTQLTEIARGFADLMKQAT